MKIGQVDQVVTGSYELSSDFGQSSAGESFAGFASLLFCLRIDDD
jgi:hypothetical protein